MVLRIIRSGKVRLKVIILLIIPGFLSLSGISQNIKTINLEEIPQRKIRKYIESLSIDQMQNFSAIRASWNKDADESDFNIMEEKFYLRFKLPEVWGCYRHANAATIWNGESIEFGLLIIKCSNSVLYPNKSSFPEIDTGQVYFLNLRLMTGLLNLPVAFEIINIDEKRKIIEFSYIENNTSQGKQTIQFFDNGDGGTRIIHRSYFKSESQFRDNLLYPYFHKKFVNDFHWNMKHLIKKAEDAVATDN